VEKVQLLGIVYEIK